MNRKLVFAALITLASGTALAADDAFKKADADQNGAISKQEAAALPKLSEQWYSYDLNTDGQLDETEFSRFEMVQSKGGKDEAK